MRLIKDHIIRNVHGNVVLAPISCQETDFQGMIVLNHSGAVVCRLLGEEIDRDSLIAGLAREYDLLPAQVAADVDSFLALLDSCHLLIHETER